MRRKLPGPKFRNVSEPIHPASQPHGIITLIKGMGKFRDESLARLTFVRLGADDLILSVPLLPSASEPLRQGFLFLINHSEHITEVSLLAIDLELGNPAKGRVIGGCGLTAHCPSKS